MFNNNKTESVLDKPGTKHEEVVSFRYSNPGLLQFQQNYEDFSHGVEQVLHSRGYHLLPGATDILASWHNGSDFIVTIRGFNPTSLVYINDVSLFRHFMKEWAPSASVWHLVAPFPRETKVNPANYTRFDPRRGY